MDFKEFANQALATCDRDAFGAPVLVFRAQPGEEELTVLGVLGLDRLAPSSAAIDEELRGSHDILGLATNTTYAQGAEAALAPAWLLTIVGRHIAPVHLVRSIGVGDWTRLPAEAAPPWALATAKTLTGCLDGKPFGTLRMSAAAQPNSPAPSSPPRDDPEAAGGNRTAREPRQPRSVVVPET